MRALTPPRAMGILFTVTCFLIFRLLPRHDLLDDSPAMNILSPRQGLSILPSSNTPTPSSPTVAPSSSSSPPPETSPSSTPQSSSTPQTSSSTPSTPQQSSSSAPTSTSSSNTPTSTTTSQPSQPPVTSAILTTNQGGQTVTSVVVVSDQASSSSSSSSTSTPTPPPGDSPGISNSTIIGLSVAGGVALMGIIGFFVWKFTRKRRNEFNDNEEIKWPELNAHDANVVPLPTHRTGGSGIDTTADVRRNSVGYAPSTAANSTAELNPDPYAVPPLPHLDPSQPYLDDPNGRFYDPYRGPVPQTFESVAPGEVIPMTQLAGRRSPGPGAAYGVDYVGGGRTSPAPQVAYGGGDFGGRSSPAPQYSAGFGARASPAPQGAYAPPGLSGRASPGPGPAYAARASPAQAYGNYSPR